MYERGNYRVARENPDSNHRKFRSAIVGALGEYRRLGLPRPRSVLDIGCFDGAFLDVAAGFGLTTYGFDTMPEALSTAAARHAVWSGALENGAVSAGFDMVMMTDVVEHVATPREYFRWVAAHLTPGGLLFITTPDLNSWAFRMLGTGWGMFDGSEHLILYTRSALERVLSTAGLQTVRIGSYWKTLTLGYFVAIALHWQFGADGRSMLPAWLRTVPLRINVGEMIAVARLASPPESGASLLQG